MNYYWWIIKGHNNVVIALGTCFGARDMRDAIGPFWTRDEALRTLDYWMK